MRRLAIGLGAVALLLVGALGWARFFADPPVSVIPGGSLRGTLAPPPTDWRIAEGIQHLPIEHRGSALPFSVRRWFILYEGRIHVILPSLFATELHDRMLVDPRVRVRIGETLYDQVGTLVDVEGAEGVYSAALPNLVRRLFAIEIEGAVRPLGEGVPIETWIWRLDDPGEPDEGAS